VAVNRLLERRNIYSFTTELVAIVIGVLIAIAIDTWFQSIEDAELEQEILSSLIIDLEAAEIIANQMLNRDQSIVGTATSVTENGAIGLVNLGFSGLGSLFATIPQELRLRTYDELDETANLRVISNRELRLLLTDFDSQARSLAGYDDQLEIQWNVTARPILYKAFRFELVPFSANPRNHNADIFQPTENELFEMYNAIIDRGNFAAVHLSRIQEILTLLEQMKSLTTSELSK